MGGDHAPDATVHGAILASAELDDSDRLFLFGDKDIIQSKLKAAGADPADFNLVHAPEMIGMSRRHHETSFPGDSLRERGFRRRP